MTIVGSDDRWIEFVADKAAVLGPCRGVVPPLTEFRISAVLLPGGCGLHILGGIANYPKGCAELIEHENGTLMPVYLRCSDCDLRSLKGTPELDVLDDSMHGFTFAKPVSVTISLLEVPTRNSAHLFHLRGESDHLSFDVVGGSLSVYVGRRAAKGFAVYVPRECRAL